MGLLNTLLRLLRSAEDKGDRSESESVSGGPTPSTETDRTDDGPATGDAAPRRDLPSDPATLVQEFQETTDPRLRLEMDIIDQVSQDPAAFTGHVDAIVELLEEDEKSGISAAILGHIAEHDPDAIVSHVSEIRAALASDDAMTREHAGDTLCRLAREQTIPVDGLLDQLVDDTCPGQGRGEAALVLGVVAAEHPDIISTDRLLELRDSADLPTRAYAGYVLAVLAGETTVEGLPPTEDAYIELVSDVVGTKLTPFLRNELMMTAIPLVVNQTVPDVGCRDVMIEREPMGTTVKLQVKHPNELHSHLETESGESELWSVLAETFELTEFEIEVVNTV